MLRGAFGKHLEAGRLMAERLEIDRIRCDGYGLCAELLPELLELDEWGYPIVRSSDVPDVLLAHARRAIEACPVLAIRLRAASAMAAATTTRAISLTRSQP
jgi:ferredoxin